MTHERRPDFASDPEAVQEKYCPACGELRPVRIKYDEEEGEKRYFCAKCQAPLGEESADSFDKPAPDFPQG
jgi:transposase-like protein